MNRKPITLTILVASYPLSGTESQSAGGDAGRSLTEWLEASGFQVYYADVDLGPRGRWRRVLAGAYTDSDVARLDAVRLRNTATGAEAQVVTVGSANGFVSAREAEPSTPPGTQ